ncbi:MAG: ABC transporter substrate-binding protein [Anaerolineales bacterium]
MPSERFDRAGPHVPFIQHLPRRSSDSKSISRRAFLGLMGTTTAGLLAACSPGSQDGRFGGAEGVQLVYQDWRTDWFPGMAQEMLGKFHSSNPKIQVYYTPDPENLDQAMVADMQAGTAPDVLAGCCDFFPGWAQQGYLLDLRPFVEADLDQEVIADWDPAQYRALFTYEGLQYALPKYHGALALFYNKDLFDEYGVFYPDSSWDHEDYRRAMQLLTKDRDGDGQVDLWGGMFDIAWERIQVHVNAWGGHFVDPSNPSLSWMARPEAMQAMRWLYDRMWDDHTMASPLDVKNQETRQAFIHGQVAMVEDGSWAIKDILEGADFRVGVAPLPAGPARRATLATTDGFGIYAGTRSPEAAWELLKFLVSKEYGRAMSRTHLLQPARESLIEEWIGHVRRAYPTASREMDLSVFAQGQLEGYSVTAEIFHKQTEARQLAREAWQQIFSLGLEPVDRMIEVSARIDLEQSQAGRR